MKYIVEFEDEPCMYEDEVHFYKCIQAPWWGLSERVIKQLTPYQPDVPDTNVGNKISKFIDGIEEIFADIRERHGDDSVCGLCEYDGAYMGQSGDWCNECPGFDKDDCFKLSDETRKKWIEEIVNAYSDHTADIGKKVSISCAHENDSISRKAAIDALWKALYEYEDKTEKQFQESEDLDVGDWIGHRIFVQNMNDIDRQTILNLPSAQPDRKLIDDYMWKIKQNISPHTAAEGVIAIKYYLEQIYEQIYGEGEKPKWMT